MRGRHLHVVRADQHPTATTANHPHPAGLDALLDEWATWMRAAATSERTIEDRVGMLRRLARQTGTHPALLEATGIATFLASRELRPGTKHTYFVGLRAWFRWLVITGRRADDPTILLVRPKVPRGRPKPIATEHLRILLASRMHARTRTMILLAAYQGLRVHEVAKIRGEDVDLVGQTLTVCGKGGVEVVLPLHPLIGAEAARYPRRGWWFPTHVGNKRGEAGPVLARSVSTIISNAMARAGVPGTAHCLRHWFLTELQRATGNARTTQELGRHASLATTAIYMLVTLDEARSALALLPTLGGE